MSSSVYRRNLLSLLSRPCSFNPCRNLGTSKPASSWLFSKDKEKTTAHSTLISNDQAVFEIVTETVVPSRWEEYLKQKEISIQSLNSLSDVKAEHVASFSIVTGDQTFKAFHIFNYKNGWVDIDQTRLQLKGNEEHQKILRSILPMITSQGHELCKSFSFWPMPSARSGGNIYDIRSYQLKPGSMYDWSNYWAKGIQYRSKVSPQAPYAGLFTQLGQLHNIYHIWCYTSMADRKQCREDTWTFPEWNLVVANTVPLIKTMSTRILEPLPFSPTQ